MRNNLFSRDIKLLNCIKDNDNIFVFGNLVVFINIKKVWGILK